MERVYIDTRETKGVYFMKIVFDEEKIIKDGLTLKEITDRLIDIMKPHNMYSPFLPDNFYGLGDFNDICQVYKLIMKQDWFDKYIYEWIECDEANGRKIVHMLNGVKTDDY